MSSPDTHAQTGGRPLTGRAVFFMVAAFFGVIFAANAVMIRLATSTFGGVMTDSAYREGLRFNQEAREAAAQASRAWRVEETVKLGDAGRALVSVTVRDGGGQPLANLDGRIRLARPTDARHDRDAALIPVSPGLYEVQIDGITAGQWDVVVRFDREGERLFLSRNRLVLR